MAESQSRKIWNYSFTLRTTFAVKHSLSLSRKIWNFSYTQKYGETMLWCGLSQGRFEITLSHSPSRSDRQVRQSQSRKIWNYSFAFKDPFPSRRQSLNQVRFEFTIPQLRIVNTPLASCLSREKFEIGITQLMITSAEVSGKSQSRNIWNYSFTFGRQRGGYYPTSQSSKVWDYCFTKKFMVCNLSFSKYRFKELF